jgi:hypothetical protein
MNGSFDSQTPMGVSMKDLTAAEIKTITDQLIVLREKLRDNGATALSPTPEWLVLRKEVAALNKKLNADTAGKREAAEAASQASDPQA